MLLRFKRLLLATILTTLGAMTAAGLAAPTPKTPTDPREAAQAGEPVEPVIDPAKLADDATLRARDAALRNASRNNLKQIALAVHSHADNFRGRLPDNVVDKDGKPLLSWRVLLLPYIEEGPLFQQFKMDEPWDSANNMALLEKIPKVYQSPRVTTKKKGYTVYQGFSGPQALFGTGKPQRFPANIPDGTSNTILALEAGTAVPWTKPLDIPFDMKKDLPDIGKPYASQPIAALCDGSTRVLNVKKISAETLKRAICPNDGMVLGGDW